MKEYIVKLNEQIGEIFVPYLEKLFEYISKGHFIVIAAVAILLSILVIAGLFVCLKRIPKLFILLVVLLGAAVGAWYLIGV